MEQGGCLGVAIIDPDATARSRLKALLSRAVMPQTSVVLECSTADAFAREGAFVRPDAVFVEMTIQDSWRRVAQDSPALLRPELVFVAASPDHASVAFDLEAVDFLTKPYSEDRVLQTVRRLWRYRRSATVQQASDVLTERQIQIIELVGLGLSNKDIARALGLSPFTVRNHMSLLFRAFQISHRSELAAVAHHQGLCLPQPESASRPSGVCATISQTPPPIPLRRQHARDLSPVAVSQVH